MVEVVVGFVMEVEVIDRDGRGYCDGRGGDGGDGGGGGGVVVSACTGSDGWGHSAASAARDGGDGGGGGGVVVAALGV